MRRRIWFNFLLIAGVLVFYTTPLLAQNKNEEALKSQADKYFQAEDYTNGYKLYSQLVSTYPKDPNLNYRLGVCMLFTDPDKKKCFIYLDFANRNISECEKEAKFYLAKAYHLNFRFDEAIQYYSQYKEIGSGSMVKKLQVDHEIQCCKNGKRLLGNLTELVVIEKKRLAEGDYFRSYNLSDIGGKLLVRPSVFTTSIDKKKNNKSIIYLPKGNEELYYASYGENDNNGKDIYIVKKLPNGEWSKPQNLGGPVNTAFDEDYPFLHPNGKVLYFASKGHTSMGGYDLFKSELDESTGKWKEPVNLDFPINSPDDDILFVTDSLEKTAYFSSGRYSPTGYIDVFKISTERRAMDFAFIKGTVLKSIPTQSVQSKIKVKNIETGEDIGTYAARENGEYNMQLPNGGKFLFTVETPGFPTQSEGVNIPQALTLKPYRQLINYEQQKLVIKNIFDSPEDPEGAYLQYLELIEEKSKLEVNAEDFVNTPPVKNNATAVNTIDTTTKNNTAANTNPKNLNNNDLIKIANDDAKELKDDAVKLKSDANDAFTFANNKNVEANEKNNEAVIAQEKANKETDPTKKQELTSEAGKLKDEAAILNSQVATANNIAKQLEIDANNKQQEADLSDKYAKQLEEVNRTKNNKEAIAKLESIQKELDALSQKKSQTSELANSIKVEADQKEQELNKAESKSTTLKKEVDDIKNDISNLDKEIAGTSDQTLIDNYKAQQEELKPDLVAKNKELETNENKVAILKKETEALNSQADFANNMLATVKSNEPVVTTANNTNPNNNTITNNNTAVNNTNPNSNNTNPNNTIATNNNNVITNTTPADTSSKSNNNVTTNVVSTNNTVSNNTNPTNNNTTNTIANNTNTTINNTTATNAVKSNSTEVENELNTLIAKNQLPDNEKENKLFGITYTDPKSLALKNQASEKFNSSKAIDTELKDKIAKLQSDLKNPASGATITDQSIQNLNSEADKLNDEALQLRKSSASLTGTEKQDAITKINELESNASEKRLKSAQDQSTLHQAQYATNIINLIELEKLSSNKNTTELTQANLLFDESKTFMNEANRIREEANAEPNIAAKIGALSNTDEKERIALFKQQQALDIYKKFNPGYQFKQAESDNSIANSANTAKLNEVKNQLSAEVKSRNDALKTLADANKNEYNAQLAALNALEKNKPNPNTEIKALKNKGQQNVLNANALLIKANNSVDDIEKNKQYVDANQKLEDAITAIVQAIQVYNSTNVVAANNTNATNTNPNNNINNNNAANNNTATNVTATTNTVAPSDATLTEAKIKEIKNTPHYKSYISLKTEADKLNTLAEKESTKAKAFYDQQKLHQEETDELRKKSDSLPDGKEKIALQKQIADLEKIVSTSKASGDSVSELASNTRAYADSKRLESDAFIQSLDKKTYDNIMAASGDKPAGGTNPTNSVAGNATTNSSEKAAVYSPVFKTNSAKYDKELKTYETAPGNESNLKAHNVVLNNYIKSIYAEITVLKKKLNTVPTNERTSINQLISDLENQAAEKQNVINTNNFKMKAIEKNNADVANANNTIKNNTTTTTAGTNPAIIKGTGFEVRNTNAYSASRPIPINETLPDGLVFRVQIGAFRNPIPNNLFKGLSPLSGETTAQGLIRYLAGLFNQFEKANAVKNDLKKLGYSDAFVVVYLNGKRISLAEAFGQLKKEGATVTIDPNSSAGITINSNVPDNRTVNNVVNNAAVTPENSSNTASNAAELNTISGMLFTVQVGVYSNRVTNTQLLSLRPIYKEKLPSGYYRYTAGIYNNIDKVKADKAKVNALGISDAFVSAYFNGERIKVTDALAKMAAGENIKFPSENPIQFGDGASTPTVVNPANNAGTNGTITPFTNGVTVAPAPTAENGVKANDEGITYKVQIGAFRNQVPQAIADNFMKIKDWPVKNMPFYDLYVYTIGSFIDVKSAKKLQQDAVNNGISDAFIIVLKDGKKLVGEEARKYLTAVGQ